MRRTDMRLSPEPFSTLSPQELTEPQYQILISTQDCNQCLNSQVHHHGRKNNNPNTRNAPSPNARNNRSSLRPNRRPHRRSILDRNNVNDHLNARLPRSTRRRLSNLLRNRRNNPIPNNGIRKRTSTRPDRRSGLQLSRSQNRRNQTPIRLSRQPPQQSPLFFSSPAARNALDNRILNRCRRPPSASEAYAQ